MSVETSFADLCLVPGDPAITPEMLAGFRDMFGGRPGLAPTPEAVLEAGSTAIVVLRDPVQVLATGLLSALDAGAALRDWREGSQILLRCRRQNRARMHLVDIDLLAGPNAAEGLEKLGALIGKVIPKAPTAPIPERAPDQVLALADGLLVSDRQDALLLAELKAEIHSPACGSDPLKRVDRALSALRLAERERALQRETLGLQVSEIEQQARTLVAAQMQAEAQDQRSRALEAELRATINRRDARLAELEAELRAEIERRDARLAALEAELARVYASTSWRVTGPLRSLRRRWA